MRNGKEATKWKDSEDKIKQMDSIDRRYSRTVAERISRRIVMGKRRMQKDSKENTW